MRAFSILLLLLLGAASPASAQSPGSTPEQEKPDPAAISALAGPYELMTADESLICPLRLEPKPAREGLLLTMDRETCTPLFGFLGEVTAWLPGIAGAILLVSDDGRTVAEFTEGVGGIYEAIRENDAVYFLANLQFVDPAARVQIIDLFGEWDLSRPGGNAICRIILSDELLSENLFAVRLAPDCDKGIVRFDPESWKLERGDIIVHSANGEQLRFGQQEGDVWARVPDKPQPLRLSRP